MFTTLFDNAPLITCLEEVLLPSLLASKQEKAIRVWSVGCSIGDEAHTLALLLARALGEAAATFRIALFATDSDPEAVKQARSFVYSTNQLGVEPLLTFRHLVRVEADNVLLLPWLQKMLTFAPHSLIRHAPFPHLDLILVHTPLSSFPFALQAMLLCRFAYALNTGGMLVLSESSEALPDPVLFHRPPDFPITCYIRTRAKVEPTTLTSARRYTVRPPADALPLSDSLEPDGISEAVSVFVEELQTTLEEREAVCQELEERTFALEQAQRELEQHARLKDDLLSLISHELRTPLTVLFTAVQGMQRRMQHETQVEAPVLEGSAFKTDVAQTLSRVMAAGKDINTLITRMLDVARLQNDLFALTLAPCNLVEQVRLVIAEMQPLTAHPLRLSTDREEVVGVWDTSWLRQVMLNLLDNASKYSDSSTEIWVRIVCPSPTSVISSVHDKGAGIERVDLPHLFERFYQGESRTRPSTKAGLGLGLYIVKEIVKRHGGRIWVESIRGVGSTFFVRLPLAREMSEPSLPEIEQVCSD